MEIFEKEMVKKVRYLRLGKIERPIAQITDLLDDLAISHSLPIADNQLKEVLEKEGIIEAVDAVRGTYKLGENYHKILDEIFKEDFN